MDVLAEALASMRTARPVSVRTNGQAPWALQLPPVAGAGFHVVLHGECWLIPTLSTGTAKPLRLAAGDVVFLRSGPEHVIADDPATKPLTLDSLAGDNALIGVVDIGGTGKAASLLCGNYHLEKARPHPLVSRLPEVIHLRNGDERHPELAAAVNLLRAELDRPRMGSSTIVPALIDSLLLYILRAWIEQGPEGSVGWATALTDPAIASALAAMHTDPAENWTVESLAVRAGLSRAAFAKRFHTLVGVPPLAYLTHWRMATAARLLRESDVSLATVAARIGYGSEFAFAKAFKRAYGHAPGGYRRLHPAEVPVTSAAAG